MAFTISRARIAPTLVKVETTVGTDSVPTGAADALWTLDSSNPHNPDVAKINFDPHSSAFTRPAGQTGARTTPVRFTTILQGAGSGTAHPSGDVLQAAGMTEVVGAGTVTYTPSTPSTCKSASVYTDYGGTITWKTLGVFGNVTMTGNPRDGLRVTFDGRGNFSVPTAGPITGFAPGTDNSKAFLSTALTIDAGTGTYTPVLDSFTFNRGARIELVDDSNASTGVKQLLFADAQPTIQLVIAMDADSTGNITYAGAVASKSLFQTLVDSTTHAVTFLFATGGAGNTIYFSGPKAELNNVTHGEKNGYRILTLDYALRHTTANAEFQWEIR